VFSIGFDDRVIRRGEIIVGELFRPCPGDRFVFVIDRISGGLGELSHDGNHLNRYRFVAMHAARKLSAWDKVATELFVDLTLQGFMGRFAWLDLSTGEFPFASQVLVGWALSQEHEALALNDGANDRN
jgi:hypothetical protein